MDKGYLISALNDAEYKQATCLAYSIKIHNKDAAVALVTRDVKDVEKQYYEPFDEIVQFPFNSKEVRRQNDWQLYWASPFDNTIAIDCQSLLKENQEQLWDYLIDGYDVAFPSVALHFNGSKLPNTNRKIYEDEYHCNNVQSAMFYWKKDSDAAIRYFKMADVIMQDWQTATKEFYSPQHIPKHYNSDIIHSLISNISGVDVNVIDEDIFSYIDMHGVLENGFLGHWDRWTDKLSVWGTKEAKVKIQNYAVSRLINYNDDNFLTNELFNDQRQYYRYTTKD